MEIGQVQSSLRLVISLKYGVLIIVNYKCKQYELSFNQPLGLGETGFITKQKKGSLKLIAKRYTWYIDYS